MPAASWAGSSAISKRLDKIAKSLQKDYQAKRPAKGAVVLAVFSFNSSRELARLRVGYAVSELLMPRFVKSPDFRVVERSELDKVLREQRLQVTGAVDDETAVRIGRLIGARVLLVGSVEKLGGKYHVTARLVDAEKGEVVALAYEELPAGLFEDQARPYLTFERGRPRRFGAFAFYNLRPSPNNLPVTPEPDYSGATIPESFQIASWGGGFRFLVNPSFAVQASGGFALDDSVVAQNHIGDMSFNIELKNAFFFRGSAFWTPTLDSGSRFYVGGGVTAHFLGQNTPVLETFSYVTPTVRAGYEHRIGDGLALSIFVNFDVLSKTGKTNFSAVEVYRLGKFSVEPSLTFYF